MDAEATKHRKAFGNMLLALSKTGLLEAAERKSRKAEASEIQKDKGGKKRQERIWEVKWADLEPQLLPREQQNW